MTDRETDRAARFLRAFLGSDLAHGTTKVGRKGRDGKIEGKSFLVREPLNEQLIRDHLSGKRGVGGIPINSEFKCNYAAIDIDTYDLNLAEVVARINKLKLPLIVCRSKSGGAHIYLFLKQAETAELVREYLVEITSALGYATSSKGTKTELFPKQEYLKKEEGDVGNFINLPYFDADKTVRYALNDDGEGMDLDEFLDAVEKKRCNLSDLEHIMLREQTEAPELKDYPPCIRRIVAMGGFSMNRNESLFHACVAIRKERPDDWLGAMEEFNSRFMVPPMTAGEVTVVQKSHQKKDYGFKCNISPMKDYCDKTLCRRAKYGIGNGEVSFPHLSGLTILQSDPRLYILNVDGKRLELSLAQINSPREFQLKCLNDLNIRPPMLKEGDWGRIINDLLKDSVELEVPPELTTEGQFLELLEEYCTSRIRALTPEEIKMGKPWTNDDKTYFSMAGLMDYLKRREFTSLTRTQVQEKIKKLHPEGGKWTDVLSVRKLDGTRSTLRAWVVPAFGLTELKPDVEEADGKIPF